MSMATITVPSGTPASLISLIQAINGHVNDQGAATWVNVRGDDGNSGNVYVGDQSVTSSNYGVLLAAGDSRTYENGGGANNVDLSTKFVLGSAASQKIDIEWQYT